MKTIKDTLKWCFKDHPMLTWYLVINEVVYLVSKYGIGLDGFTEVNTDFTYSDFMALQWHGHTVSLVLVVALVILKKLDNIKKEMNNDN